MQNIHKKIAVSEDFFSIQEEGLTAGTPSVFIRLGGESKTIYDYSVKLERMDYIEKLRNGAHLIFIGEEPLLQQEKIVSLLTYLNNKFNIAPYVEIETNGVFEPSEVLHRWVGHYNISPKLSNSGIELKDRIKLDVLRNDKFKEKGILKWVLSTRKDLAEMMSVLSNLLYFKENPSKVWLIPFGSNREHLYESSSIVSEFCKKHLFMFSSGSQIVNSQK